MACDPVSSLQAIGKEKDTSKAKATPRPETKTTRVLSTHTQDQGGQPGNGVASQPKPCFMCSATTHALDDCPSFLTKSLPERKNYINTNRLCFGCLRKGHVSKDCRSRRKCKTCNQRHPTSLHGDVKTKTKEGEDMNQTAASADTPVVNCGFSGMEFSSCKSTMIVPVLVSHCDNPSKEIMVYPMLDTQSDSTFVLDDTCDDLGIIGPSVQLRLSTMLAKNEVVSSKRVAGLRVRGVHSSSPTISLPGCYTRNIMPVNRSHIPRPEMAEQWPHLRSIAHHLHPVSNCNVGLLIGYNCPKALTPREVVVHRDGGPYAQRTDLGWGIVGVLAPTEITDDPIGVSHRIAAAQLEPGNLRNSDQAHIVLRSQVKELKASIIGHQLDMSPVNFSCMMALDFCEREVPPSSGLETASQEDLKFLKLMRGAIHVNDGHYEMPLPMRDPTMNLPNNREAAVKPLVHLGRKLQRNPALHRDYTSFMEGMIAKGHAEPIPEDDETEVGRVWYIPHHGVYHPKKPTKLRVVFDCSARYGSTSLNDQLLQGPDMTNKLVGVLLCFRKEPVALTCDVEAMFHQFYVNKEHRNLLRFLWWNNGKLDDTPTEFRMTVHVFGAASSPACANFGLKKIAEHNAGEFGDEAAAFISDDFYVDDGLKSLPDAQSAIHLARTSTQLCKKGGLRLHKFMSNSKEVLNTIPEVDRAQGLGSLDLALDDLPPERALGVHWCVENDTLGFRITLQDQPLTRRGILSSVSSIYDPLGFAAPFVLKGKQILQEMCRDKLDWDEPLPDSLRPQWESWRDQITHLSDLVVPRCTKPADFGDVEVMELHHFSDASLSGYGCCSYLRQINTQGQVHCALVLAKSRVSPLKAVTVPRLELAAAVTAARNSKLLQRELQAVQISHTYWTDSKVVLGYIANEKSRYHIFVANRIQTIRDISEPSQWNHVPTEHNPADLASRGCCAVDLMNTPSWFKGPGFLWEKVLPPREEPAPIPSDDPEVKGHTFATKCHEENDVLSHLRRLSSWSKMKRVMAICLNIKDLLNRTKKVNQISSTDMARAEEVIIKLVQQECFKDELQDLTSATNSVKSNSSVLKLDPFIDEKGFLRVGGRVRASSLPFHVKHPLLLPKNHYVSRAILYHFHQRAAHQGRGITIGELRDNGYWVVGATKAVASIISQCVHCRRLRGRNQDQKMADLPQERLEPAAPFTYSGMDLFGPFHIKQNRKELKRWGCVFTCLASWAIHIEVTPSLSTDAFINALRRFTSLRGSVQQLRCDQGTNFVGANRELTQALQEIDEDRVRRYFADRGCDFSFNPPHASHMGGVWERQIRTVRSILASLLAEHGTLLDDDSLRTLMAETTAVVNSRPLTTDTLNDPTSLMPLTPNHLLTGKSSVLLPPPGNFQKPDLYSRKHWRRVQYLANLFWSRWRQEYVQQLQHRQRWSHPRRNLTEGDIVLMVDDNLPRCQWRLGQVSEAMPSQDGHVRKVKVKVGDPLLDKKGKRMHPPSELERPIQKLVVLLEADAEEPDGEFERLEE